MLSESQNIPTQEPQEHPMNPQEQAGEKSESLLERLQGYGQAIKEKVASFFSRRQEAEKIIQQVDKEASFTDEELAQLDDIELRAKVTEQSS